jgi:hypothetical protein
VQLVWRKRAVMRPVHVTDLHVLAGQLLTQVVDRSGFDSAV